MLHKLPSSDGFPCPRLGRPYQGNIRSTSKKILYLLEYVFKSFTLRKDFVAVKKGDM